MRDEKDKATLGDLLPAKRGRPCLDLDNGPLTPAERAKRYRRNRTDHLADVKRACRGLAGNHYRNSRIRFKPLMCFCFCL